MHCGGNDEKRSEEKDVQASHKAEERKSYQKENVGSVDAEVEEEGKLNSLDTYRGKQLPPGLKLKKRVSHEERNSPKGNSVEKVTNEVQDKTKKNHTEQEEAEPSTSGVKAVHPEKINQTSQHPHKGSPQQPTDDETCPVEQTVKESVSKSAQSGSTQSPKYSDNPRNPTSNTPTQSESSQTKKHQDNHDDDVVLVSVKPATQKTPPVSAVQKPLTAFAGFQPASKVQGQQEDPKGLRRLLTAQLQQKKVSKSTNTGFY